MVSVRGNASGERLCRRGRLRLVARLFPSLCCDGNSPPAGRVVRFCAFSGATMNKITASVAAIAALIGTPAFSADMAVKAPPPATARICCWAGWYVGGNVGGGWGHRDVTYAPNDPVAGDLFTPGHSFETPRSPSFDVSGVIGGIQLGYNYQFNRNWLVGFETDFDWSGMKGSSSTALPDPTLTTAVDEHIKWFGTVRGRFGYLPVDNLLAYVTGGFAYGRVDHTANMANVGTGGFGVDNGTTGFFCDGGFTCFAGSSGHTATGWTLGGGLEYAFWQKWSVKAEYLYVSLNGSSVTET